MKIRGIEVDPNDFFAQTKRFRVYLGNSDKDGPVILKVAKTFEDNDVLNEDAATFTRLAANSQEIDEYETSHGGGNRSRFDLLFASLLSTFVEASQGDRRINVYRAPDTKLSKLLPLSKLKADYEIDARSCVWMMGRILKFYILFEKDKMDGEETVARYPDFYPEDFLIGPERHRVIYYNYSGGEDDSIADGHIKAIAKFFLEWIVVNDEAEQRLYNLLKDFSEHGRSEFYDAHSDLYALASELWGRGVYYPFTYRVRGTIAWQKQKEEEE